MGSTTTDRRIGLNSGAAFKVPCKAASTANLVLSGEQTVDGVACVTGDRVLVKNQTDQTTNGIWVASTASWTRDLDFDGNLDAVTGTQVMTLSGTANSNSFWRLATTGAINFGSSLISFARSFVNDSSFISFIQAGTGAVARTVQDKLRESVSVVDFGAVLDGVTDDTAAVNAAIAYVASLTGPQYADTMGQSPYGYGVSRRISLAGKKALINSTITLAGNIGIDAMGGGFLAGPSLSAGAYMVDTGSSPYCGRVNDLVLDGAGRNVKGANINNAFMTRWKGLSVINCANDSITVQANGPEFYLTDFDIAGCATLSSVNVAGLRVLGSDGNYCNGVIKYTPIGVAVNGGGNNNFTNIHPWGEYAAFKMYVPFWLVNSSRNMFTGCYGDSPAKQDYTQAVSATVNSIPNGGMCFNFDANSAQNQVIGGRGFISTPFWSAFAAPWSGSTAYTAQQIATSSGVTYCCILGNTNQAPPNATYWTVIPANQFYLGYIAGQYNQLFGVNYNYAGNWAGDWLFASDAVRDSGVVFGSPTVPNGTFPARLGMLQTNAGATVRFTVTNSDLTANANSSSQTAYNVNGTDIGADAAVLGAGGVSYMPRYVNGTERHRSTSRGLELTGGALILKTVQPAVSAGEVALGNATATTVGAAGGASALPATPLGYLSINVGGVYAKIPYYNN